MAQGVYVFYLELVTDMLHLFVYLIFFVIVFTNYGLPLHLVRPWGPPPAFWKPARSCPILNTARASSRLHNSPASCTSKTSFLLRLWTPIS